MNSDNALQRAWDVQRAASQVGFDWDTITGALEKVEEEIHEVRAAADSNDMDAAREELGDLFFAVVNVSRFLNAHPNEALLAATEKFSRRFDAVCAIIESEGTTLSECTLTELDVIWDRVKACERDEKK